MGFVNYVAGSIRKSLCVILLTVLVSTSALSRGVIHEVEPHVVELKPNFTLINLDLRKRKAFMN